MKTVLYKFTYEDINGRDCLLDNIEKDILASFNECCFICYDNDNNTVNIIFKSMLLCEEEELLFKIIRNYI